MLRITAGKWRSRRLEIPPSLQTRPIPDRVKQALFSMLAHRFDRPGDLPPLVVADLFSGSGALGLEALSRGVMSCTFFERDREALQVLRANIESLAAGMQALVSTRDAWSANMQSADGEPFDLVFLDPPYSDSDDASAAGRVQRFLARIAEDPKARPLVILHHRARVRYGPVVVSGWRIIDSRTFGTSAVTLFERDAI